MPNASRVLVVEDDVTIRTLIAEALEGEGYDVVTASNGAEALMMLVLLKPDAILLDLMMPVMDGRAFLAARRQDPRDAAIPVLILSAAHDLGALAPELGARACMAKPFDLDVLLAVVEHLVQSGEAARDPRGSAPLVGAGM
jgi:CheY-like chemotaxis protein